MGLWGPDRPGWILSNVGLARTIASYGSYIVMADRIPIFGAKAAKCQIGYVENGGAFDLSGRRRCNYDAATGNLPIPLLRKLLAMYRLPEISLFHRGSRPSCLNNLAIVKFRRRIRLPSMPKNT